MRPMSSRSSHVPFGLVLIRFVAGAIAMTHGWGWIRDAPLSGSSVRRAVSASVEDLPGIVAWWGETLLLSNPDGVAFLWTWAAFLVGAALTSGALTRPAGTLAALFAFHGALYGPEEHLALFQLYTVAAIACAAGAAGRRLGLDSELDSRLPTWLTWNKDRGPSIFG